MLRCHLRINRPALAVSGESVKGWCDLDIVSTALSLSAGIADWEAAAAAHAAKAAKQRFSATESHKQQVMSQVAGLHRMAAAQDAGGLW